MKKEKREKLRRIIEELEKKKCLDEVQANIFKDLIEIGIDISDNDRLYMVIAQEMRSNKIGLEDLDMEILDMKKLLKARRKIETKEHYYQCAICKTALKFEKCRDHLEIEPCEECMDNAIWEHDDKMRMDVGEKR